MLIVKADSNIHCVSKINNGIRSILKLIYTQTPIYNKKYKDELQRFNF